MKNIILIAAFLFAADNFIYGQNQIVDTHPGATIYTYDPQSGQEVLAESNEAILFKDAVVELVSNTGEARMIAHSSPGHKTIIITQAAPDQGDAYQIEMDSKYFGQNSVLYTFSYNVDQNTLYYLDQGSQSWVPEQIQDNNLNNLNNSYTLGKFNDPATWNTTTDDGTGDTPVQANIPPPPLQENEQPPCPVDGYLWQPGYWAFNRYSENYYWVAGTWVAPPDPGYLWTPPYWGYDGGVYAFHSGYWGLTIGFYGGINYGYGYGGRGYYGGEWDGGHFRYNTAVVRVNTTVVHNTYVDRTVIVNNTVVNNNKVSFNGPGGVAAKPTPQEVKVAAQPHIRDVSQDPKAPKATAKPFVAGQNRNQPNNNVSRNVGDNTQRTPGLNNTQKTPGNNMQRTPGINNPQETTGNNNMQRTPGTNNAQETTGNNNMQRMPANTNSQKTTGANNTPKPAGAGPGVPRVPGNGPGGARVQRQPVQQGQYGNQKGGTKQTERTEKNPPQPDDKKKP